MNHSQKKLFDLLTCHEEDLIGAIFTTYSFSSKYFESTLLPDLLKVDRHEEMQERLQALDLVRALEEVPVSVIMDGRSNLDQTKFIPNYDLHPIYNARQHSKVSLFIFESSIKLIIASANLTKKSIHEFRECYVELNFTHAESDWKVLNDCKNFLFEMCEANRIEPDRALKLLNQKYEQLAPKRPSSQTNLKFIGVKPGGPAINFGSEVNRFWEMSSLHQGKVRTIKQIYVVSPFYEAENKTTIMETLNKSIKRSLHQQKEDPFYILHIPTCEGNRMTKFPIESYSKQENWQIHRYPDRVSIKEVRFPHLKSYLITDNENYSLFMTGSSNFSPSAFGTKPNCNWEANLLYFKESFSSRDYNYFLPPINLMEPKELMRTFESSEFLQDTKYPYPVVLFAEFDNSVLKIELYKDLNEGCSIKLGARELSGDFKGLKIEIPINGDLPSTSLVISDPLEGDQFFPINIKSGSVVGSLSSIDPNKITEYIEERYRYGRRLRLSDFILAYEKKAKTLSKDHEEFDTRELLLYKIRQFNQITTKIFQHIKQDIDSPHKLRYHLNGRFGLVECLKTYQRMAMSSEEQVQASFKCLETVTQVLLAFEECQNQESLTELQTFMKTYFFVKDHWPKSDLQSQIIIYQDSVDSLYRKIVRKIKQWA